MSESSWKRNRHSITCCKDCVPPKRYPGCGDHCKEYKEEKAKVKKQMEDYKKSQRPVYTNFDFDYNGRHHHSKDSKPIKRN